MFSIRIAVGFPVYNGKDYLPTAIKSILDQQENVDCYVYDNSEDDLTYKSIEHCLGANVFYQRNGHNLGYLGNMNKCLELAYDGRYTHVAILHHDDFHIGRSLASIRRAALENPSVGIFYSSACHANAEGDYHSDLLYDSGGGKLFAAGEKAISCCWDVPCSAMVYNASVIRGVGLLNPKFPYSAEIEHYARVGSIAGVFRFDNPIAAMRLHKNNYRYRTWGFEDFIPSFIAMIEVIEGYYGVPRAFARRAAIHRHVGTFSAIIARLVILGEFRGALRAARPIYSVKASIKVIKLILIGVVNEFFPDLISKFRRVK